MSPSVNDQSVESMVARAQTLEDALRAGMPAASVEVDADRFRMAADRLAFAPCRCSFDGMSFISFDPVTQYGVYDVADANR
jgi:hypothetical protein